MIAGDKAFLLKGVNRGKLVTIIKVYTKGEGKPSALVETWQGTNRLLLLSNLRKVNTNEDG